MNKYYIVKSMKIPCRFWFKNCLVCLLFFITIVAFYSLKNLTEEHEYEEVSVAVTEDNFSHHIHENETDDHENIVSEYYAQRKGFALSNLGKILYLNEPLPPARDRDFKILVWKRGEFLEKRHIRYFTKERHNPFAKCSVNNCKLTYKDEELDGADAVIIHLQSAKGLDSLPPEDSRDPRQRWIFLSDESPFNTFQLQHPWQNYNGYFNWSMTYRAESDVPVAYGRTVGLEKSVNFQEGEDLWSLIPNINEKRRDVLVGIVTSNCRTNNAKMAYVTELQQYLDVDVYGKCGTELKDECPGLFGSDCPRLNQYLFYLAFENSNCNEYITEKPWWHGFTKGAVPIIMGSNSADSKMFFPPNSYIHVNDYARPSDLARYLLFLNETWDDNFLMLHEWRRHFMTINEHGYYKSPSVHYCRVCEALNYNDEAPQALNDLSLFLSGRDNCVRKKIVEYADKSIE